MGKSEHPQPFSKLCGQGFDVVAHILYHNPSTSHIRSLEKGCAVPDCISVWFPSAE